MRTLPELQYESSYVEDGALYVLVLPKELSDDRRYTIEADPDTRKIKDIAVCLSTDDGIEQIDFKPTEEDLAILQEIASKCSIDSDDRE